jgi:eukaryotic-like serine/threonine-protein kinase
VPEIQTVPIATRPVTSPAPSPEAPPTDAPPRTAGAPVRFHVLSDPLGARVSLEGRELGETPLDFEVPAGESGSASAELTFSLEGYQRQIVTAAGTGPEVVLNQKLQRKPPPPKNRPKSSTTPGYKEDPY